MIHHYILIIFISSFFGRALGSTFVDNGGTIYEAELRVTIEQLKRTLRSLELEMEEDLCICTKYDRSTTCNYLSQLSMDEVNPCQKFIKKNEIQMAKILPKVLFRLTDKHIYHKHEKTRRPVQAGTQKNKKIILINQEHFIKLDAQKRLMLLVHELGHLLKWNQRWINDHKKYKGITGKILLDSVGASLSTIAYRRRYTKTSTSRFQSKYYSKHFVSARFGNLNLNRKDVSRSLIPKSMFTTTSLHYRYQDGHHGFTMGTTQGNKTRYKAWVETIKVVKNSIGYSFKFRPLANKIGFWGHSHILVQSGLNYTKINHKIHDSYVSRDASNNFIAPYLSSTIAFSFLGGFWFELTGGISKEQLISTDSKVNINNMSNFSSLGVSYGF